MINMFNDQIKEITDIVNEWEQRLLDLEDNDVSLKRNKQNRTIKQIIGHLIDSATNNTHRIVHLQYQECPCIYPDYANKGNNDRWIAIQNYNDEDWCQLVQLWKYCNLHIAFIMKNVKKEKLQNEWLDAFNRKVTLEDMIIDYPRHLILHISEIRELLG